MVANKANNSSHLSSGFVPRSISFPSSSPPLKSPSSRPNSMVIKAQQDRQETAHLHPAHPLLYFERPVIDFAFHEFTPWGSSKTTEKEIMMSFNMPGVDASQLEVMILGDELNIMFKGPMDMVDALGRKITLTTGLPDTKIQLPPNCAREKVEAEFKNGILYVRIPRMTIDRTVPMYVPVRAIV